MVLVSALFALAAAQTKVLFLYLAYFPAVAFWVLDGYFLHQERVFRALYDHVPSLDDDDVGFSMDTRPVASALASWGRTIFSLTLVIFHGAVIGSILVVMLIAP